MIEQMLQDLAEIFYTSQISPAAGVALIPAFYKLYPEEFNKLIDEKLSEWLGDKDVINLYDPRNDFSLCLRNIHNYQRLEEMV